MCQLVVVSEEGGGTEIWEQLQTAEMLSRGGADPSLYGLLAEERAKQPSQVHNSCITPTHKSHRFFLGSPFFYCNRYVDMDMGAPERSQRGRCVVTLRSTSLWWYLCIPRWRKAARAAIS